jgi:copper chaperone CopZ
MTTELKIYGMSCMHCLSSVHRALASVPGVGEVQVFLDSGTARIDGEVEPAILIQAVTEAGYSAEPIAAG